MSGQGVRILAGTQSEVPGIPLFLPGKWGAHSLPKHPSAWSGSSVLSLFLTNPKQKLCSSILFRTSLEIPKTLSMCLLNHLL